VDPTVKERVFEIIQKTVHIDPATLDADREIRDQVSLDSMQYVTLTAVVEKELDIELPISVMQARTINDFLRVIDEVLEQAGSGKERTY
jgi:acyl carrier protein